VLIKMRKARYLLITALPMLFVGLITLSGSYEMFTMFLSTATTLATGKAVALYVDAVLVAVVAVLGLVVLSDSARQWYGYLVQKRPYTSSEIVVMAGGGSAGNLHPTLRRDDEGFRLPNGTGCC
jgi:carbon starvation protein